MAPDREVPERLRGVEVSVEYLNRQTTDLVEAVDVVARKVDDNFRALSDKLDDARDRLLADRDRDDERLKAAFDDHQEEHDRITSESHWVIGTLVVLMVGVIGAVATAIVH